MNSDAEIITGWVRVAYSQYYLMSAGANEPEPPNEDGRILSSEADEGSLYITSDTHTGLIRLTVHVFDEEPPRDDSDWHHVEESEILTEDGELAVMKWGGGTPEGFDDLAAHGPGTYQVRVHVRRRPVQPGDISPQENIDEELDLERGIYEEHLIQLWPIEG